MSDKIVLSGIQFYGYHGASQEERKVGGRYKVDIELKYDLKRAGETDKLQDTIDYEAVHNLVVEIGRNNSFHLLETLAERIARGIFEEFPVDEVFIRVTKENPKVEGILNTISVEIRRRRNEEAPDR